MNMLTVLTLLTMEGVSCLSAFGQTREIPTVQREPKMAGEVDAAGWAGAAHFTEFRETAEKRQSDIVPPGLRTEAWLARTAAGLCVAFRCYHDQMSQMVTAVKTHDGPVWADDSVEVFLDAQDTHYSYYHFIANAAGALYDAYNKEPSRGDATWDSGAVAAGRLLTDGYSVEIIIPWTSLNLGLNSTGAIGLNLCRNIRYTVGRQSLFGEYHKPGTWQGFRLDQTGPKWFPIAAEQIEWSPLSGTNELVARFRNLTRAPLRLPGEFFIMQGEQRQEQKFEVCIEAEKITETRLTYTVAEGSEVQFGLALKNAKGEEILTSYRIVQPKPIAQVSMDTDVLERGENPTVTVSLFASKASAQDYAVQFDVRTPEGTQVLRRAVPPGTRTRPEPTGWYGARIAEALDLSAAPRSARRLEIETTVMNVRTGQAAFRGKTPILITESPWTVETK
jgi:hypothetical protein